jgi:hypothetical protein
MTFSSHASLRALLLGAIGCQAASSDAPATPVEDVVDVAAPQADVSDAVVAPDVPDEPSCVDPAPVLIENGEPTGFVKCADGAINRVASATFKPVNTGEACHGDEVGGGCLTDDECSAGPNGRCIHYSVSDGGPFCNCEYACATDEDCATGTVCVPAELSENATYPRCVAAACKHGDDCPSGECGLADFFNGCFVETQLRCRDVEKDACHSDDDCADARVVFTCDVEAGSSAFACVSVGCDVGRPLLVAGTPRVAPTVRRVDWNSLAT